MTNQHDQNERLDHATRQRLARLGSLPVDTSPLEHKLRAAGVSLGGSSRHDFPALAGQGGSDSRRRR
ncbi:MAG: hypothetical protein R3C45_12755 [Phycisphaerales bacterium]